MFQNRKVQKCNKIIYKSDPPIKFKLNPSLHKPNNPQTGYTSVHSQRRADKK